MDALDLQAPKIMDRLDETAATFQAKLTALVAEPEVVCAKASYLAFFVRSRRIFRAFRLLVQAGYGPEAEMLLRPLFETLIDWLYIALDPENRGERYLLYQAAARLHYLRKQGRTSDAESHVATNGDSIKEYCEKYGITGGKLPRDWSGISVHKKMIEAGLSNYPDIYAYQSNLMHNNPAILAKYVDASNPEYLLLLSEASHAGLKPAVAIGSMAFGLCLQKANEHFCLQADAVLEDIAAELRRYAQDED